MYHTCKVLKTLKLAKYIARTKPGIRQLKEYNFNAALMFENKECAKKKKKRNENYPVKSFSRRFVRYFFFPSVIYYDFFLAV